MPALRLTTRSVAHVPAGHLPIAGAIPARGALQRSAVVLWKRPAATLKTNAGVLRHRAVRKVSWHLTHCAMQSNTRKPLAEPYEPQSETNLRPTPTNPAPASVRDNSTPAPQPVAGNAWQQTWRRTQRVVSRYPRPLRILFSSARQACGYALLRCPHAP